MEAKRKSHATTQRKRSSDGDKEMEFFRQEAAKEEREDFG